MLGVLAAQLPSELWLTVVEKMRVLLAVVLKRASPSSGT